MVNFSLLAPIIVGGIIAVIGIALLVWMNRNEPQLASARPEEEAHDPFEHENPVVVGTMPNVTTRSAWDIAHEVWRVSRASKKGAATRIPTETNVSYAHPTKAERERA